MTPAQVAIAIAPQVRDGLVANSDNPAGFWLELMVVMAGFCQASRVRHGGTLMITALALSAAVTATCNWGDRGLDPYMLDVPSAVDTYTQIPKATREALKAKMRARQYDDTAHITGAGIKSATWNYGPLRMMHFGNGSRLCGVVNTSMWSAGDPGERALIYTVGDWSIAVPSVCRNVSLITRGERITPPSPMRTATPPVDVEPLPVTADVVIPPIVGDIPQGESFAQQFIPPVATPPWDDYPERQSTDQPWLELRSWRLLGPLGTYSPAFWPAVPQSPIALPVGPFVPVPGITPPTVVPEPMPDAVPAKPGLPDGKPVPGNVAPIPEASTWALWLFGLALLTVAVRPTFERN
jgi:hypothetical protein